MHVCCGVVCMIYNNVHVASNLKPYHSITIYGTTVCVNSRELTPEIEKANFGTARKELYSKFISPHYIV
jgi:hypothetical protein